MTLELPYEHLYRAALFVPDEWSPATAAVFRDLMEERDRQLEEAIAKLPAGELAYDDYASSTASVGTTDAYLSLEITFQPRSWRRIRVEGWQLFGVDGGASQFVTAAIKDGANTTTYKFDRNYGLSATGQVSCHPVYRFTTGENPGEMTFRLYGSTAANTVTALAGAGYESWLAAYDLGSV